MSHKHLQKICSTALFWLLLMGLVAACGAPISSVPISVPHVTTTAIYQPTLITVPHGTATVVSQQKPTPTSLGTSRDQSFLTPEVWGATHSAIQPDDVLKLADVNYDGKQDIVKFDVEGVWTALSTGTGFAAEFLYPHFGKNQGWNSNDHIRTLADVNGDGKQDIVGFGNGSVAIALSTGTGFAAPTFYPEFGYDKGWRVDKHVRTMADLNGDGRQDIVGFGDEGVWTALSTGTGFATPTSYPEFGINKGWYPNSDYPRYVGDLNGDGYLDIVGYGEEAVYRALGGPAGFGSPYMIIRYFRQKSPIWDEPKFSARFLADVDGNGMQDLVGFAPYYIYVSLSSDSPPPNPPAAPDNIQLTGSTTTSLSYSWNDNSDDERSFYIKYYYPESKEPVIVGANITSAILKNLDAGTRYCIQVYAENLWGFSRPSEGVCDQTLAEPTPTPLPPPPEQGVKSLFVFNCDWPDNHTIHVWTLDYTIGVWQERGTLPAQWDTTGSCPGSAEPLVVQLSDGHLFRFVAVDPESSSCGGENDPQNGGCQRRVVDPIMGNENGVCVSLVIQGEDQVVGCN